MSEKEFYKLIKKFDQNIGIKSFYNLGGKREEMKDSIIKILSPFYKNPKFLKENALLCIPDAIGYVRYIDNPIYRQPFKDCLKIYNTAKDINPIKTFTACADWNSLIENAISKVWSILYIHDDVDVSVISDKAFNYFEIIKTTIEGMIQPFLRCLLAHIKIIQGSKSDFDFINQKNLGLIIKEILDSGKLKNLLEPQPYRIRINHWRNIAAHDANWSIKMSKIYCEYGSPKKRNKFDLSIKELEKMAQRFIFSFYVLRCSYSIFTGDNFEDVIKLIPEEKHRPELVVSPFVGGLLIQGLDVKELKYNSNLAKMKINVISLDDPFENLLDSFQLLIGLWELTKSQLLNIEYWKDNEKYIVVQVEAEYCKKNLKEEIDFKKFSEHVEVLFTKRK